VLTICSAVKLVVFQLTFVIVLQKKSFVFVIFSFSLQLHSTNNLSVLRVVAGEHSLSNDSGIEQIRNVVGYTMHENYNSRSYENDIALIFVINVLVDMAYSILESFIYAPNDYS